MKWFGALLSSGMGVSGIVVFGGCIVECGWVRCDWGHRSTSEGLNGIWGWELLVHCAMLNNVAGVTDTAAKS